MSSNLASPTNPPLALILGPGVVPAQQIKRMLATGEIATAIPPVAGQIQPASLDLRLGTVAYRVRASFLPGRDTTVADRLADFEMHRIDLGPGAVLEKGCVYLVPLVESLALPRAVSAVANAKSSTGRLDLFTRLITDHGTEFDRIEAGYHGPLYAEISPRSFSVLVRPGMRLNQIRFRHGSARPRRRGAGGVARAASASSAATRASRAGSPSRSTWSRRRAGSPATGPSPTPGSSISTASASTTRPNTGSRSPPRTAASSSIPAPSTSW